MAVKRIAKNKYQVRCRHQGKQVKRTFDNKWDAADYERLVAGQGRTPDDALAMVRGYTPKTGLTGRSPLFSEWVETWHEALLSGDASANELPVQESTADSHRNAIARALPVIGQIRLDELTLQHYRQLKNELNTSLKPSTANTTLARAKQALRYACQQELLERNPFEHGKPIPDHRPDKPFWRKDQVTRFLETVRGIRRDHYVYFLVALKTAMRRSELLGLQKGDVCFETNTITVSRQWDVTAYRKRRAIDFKAKLKNGAPFKRIPMTEGLAAELADYLSNVIGDETRLFYWPVSHMMRPGVLIKDYAPLAGVPAITGHGTRDSAIGNLKIEGVTDWDIAQIAGCTIDNLKKYGHLNDEDVRRAVNRLD